ncbi:hypothetical protein [Novosphingobium soli]|uniref:DNA-directed DNA polymerase family A palm domain-containing protein n=1 Tax=Novosphingobium soli TaxID=574956 RepID=A0ABV6CQB5_9SPHN
MKLLIMLNSQTSYLIQEAGYLAFIFKPNSVESTNLIFFLVEENKPNKGRRSKPSREFTLALGVMVAALLKQASVKIDGYLFRTMNRDSFIHKGLTDIPFGYRPFKAVVAGLKAKGYLEVVTGFKESTNIHDQGIATRFRATPKLITLAEQYGIKLSDWASHFTMLPKPKLVREPLQLRADSWTDKNRVKRKGGRMDYDPADQSAARHAKQVHDINTFVADQDIQPAECHFAFTRIFAQGDHPDFRWNKGARLYSYGFGKGYQNIPKAERRTITINGEPTVEVDISASYLTILHTLMGVPLPADPYDIPGVPRKVTKIWATITLGHTGFHSRWPEAAKRRYTSDHENGPADLQKDYPFGKTQGKILDSLQLLKDWPKNPISWADLQFLESSAVVDAVHRLAMDHRVVALPLHDALIVPRSKAALAEQVLSDCFLHHVGVRPGLTVKGAKASLAA